MDVHLHTKINDVVEAFRVALHQQAPYWSTIRTPAALFDFEQGLQAVLNRLQTAIVGAVLEAIHRDRDFVTACQNQSRLQRGVYSDGWHDVRVQTLGGHFVHLKTPYAKLPKERKQERREKKLRQQGTGLYPVLRRLGIVRRTTPRLLVEANRHLADGPSAAEAAERLASREIRLTEIPLWLLVRDFASIALWQRQMAAAHLEHVTVLEPAPLAGKRVVVGLDGGRLRLRIDKRESEQTQTRRYTPQQCEPKLFAIYTIDHQGKKERHGYVLYEGTLQSAAHLFTLLKLRLKQLGITHASELILIGDGASWIWKRVPDLRASLGLADLRVIEIVDWAHAAEKLMPPAKAAFQEPKQQQHWFKRMRTCLKHGDVSTILTALHALDARNDKDQVIRTAIHYFQTHQARMQYEQFRSKGLPLGSGSIESGVRRIVNLRLKGASLFWHPENAEAILYLRCQIKSGRWVSFVKAVLTQWATDMATSLTQAYHVREAIATAVGASHPPKAILDTRQDVITWARQVVETGEALILDTETTGLDTTDEIIQLAMVDLHGNVLLDTLVRPTKPIAPEARAIHGITDQALADAPPFSALYQALAPLLRHRLVLAYNAAFDRRLLAQTCTTYGLPPLEIAAWDCVMERYACFWGEEWANTGSFRPQSLSTACTQQGIGVHGHHEAVQDCLLTLALIKAMAGAGEEET
jgi:DNA polymerase III epsilon subunit-like protein